MRVPTEVGKLENLSLLTGKAAECRHHPRPAIPKPGFLHDVFRNIFVFGPAGVHSKGPAPQPLLTPDGIDRTMVDERQEERSECASRGIESLGRLPQREEGVVHHVLRQQLLTRHAIGEAERGGGVAAVQLFERLTVSQGQPVVEIVVALVFPLPRIHTNPVYQMCG